MHLYHALCSVLITCDRPYAARVQYWASVRALCFNMGKVVDVLLTGNTDRPDFMSAADIHLLVDRLFVAVCRMFMCLLFQLNASAQVGDKLVFCNRYGTTSPAYVNRMLGRHVTHFNFFTRMSN